MSRPEYVVCVMADAGPAHDLHKKTWCGQPANWSKGLMFVSVDHAAFNGYARRRLVCCPECSKAIIKALTNGQEGAVVA